MALMTQPKRYFAFVDESGAKGHIRDLDSSRDEEFALMVGIIIDAAQHAAIENVFTPGFNKFKTATPVGKALHFAEAFHEDPNGPWATTAKEVRAEFFSLLKHHKLPIIYSVFRVSDKRREYDALQATADQAQANQTSAVEINRQVDKSSLETDTFKDLLVKLGTWAEDESAVVDVFIDNTSSGLLADYRRANRDLAALGGLELQPRAFDRQAGEVVTGMKGVFTLMSNFPVPIKAIERIGVSTKEDPLILVVDGVANSLYNRLKNAPAGSNLEQKACLGEWELNSLLVLGA